MNRVRQHYDDRKERGKKDFYTSPIVNLKKLNNWVKTLLIEDYLVEKATVLDLCGGRGGDLAKWTHGNVKHVTLVDNSEKQIQFAKQRYDKLKPKFTADIFVGDATAPELQEKLQPKQFDLVSCQFALHYCFETETKATQTLATISAVLKPGGYFILTIPDAHKIQSLCSFQNKCCRLKYVTPPFGAAYYFSLDDAITKCPEFLVDMDVLIELAAKFKLKVSQDQSFQRIFKERKDQKAQHLAKIMQVPSSLQISDSEWETFGLYRAVSFRKIN